MLSALFGLRTGAHRGAFTWTELFSAEAVDPSSLGLAIGTLIMTAIFTCDPPGEGRRRPLVPEVY